MIQAVGKLSNTDFTQRGTSNFPVLNIDLEVGNSALRMTAKGQDAYRLFTLLDPAPEGSLVEVFGGAEFRPRQTGEGSFLDLVAYDALLLGNIGTPGASFRMQGFIKDVKSVPKRDGGSFEMGVFAPLAFNRDGAFIQTDMDITLDDQGLLDWRSNAGKWALVRGTVSGQRTEREGVVRIWPRFKASGLTVSEPPSWLAEYGPGVPDSLPSDVEEAEFTF
jgi:hypothetical protein